MDFTRIKALHVSTIALFCVAIGLPVAAQERETDIARDLAALRVEVERLRAEVDALKSGGAAGAPTPSMEMLQTQVAELAQVKVESTTRFPVKLFGNVHGSVFA